MTTKRRLFQKPAVWGGAALIAAGIGSGAVLGSTLTAGAATNSSGSASSSAPAPSGATGAAPTPGGTAPAGGARCDGPGRMGLPESGTVSAVGSNSVTIGTTTYAVTSSSDIDKNGEATLSDLKVGDAVRFSTVSGAATPTIDRLHAGNEALNRPAGPPPGAPGPASGSTGTATAG